MTEDQKQNPKQKIINQIKSERQKDHEKKMAEKIRELLKAREVVANLEMALVQLEEDFEDEIARVTL